MFPNFMNRKKVKIGIEAIKRELSQQPPPGQLSSPKSASCVKAKYLHSSTIPHKIAFCMQAEVGRHGRIDELFKRVPCGRIQEFCEHNHLSPVPQAQAAAEEVLSTDDISVAASEECGPDACACALRSFVRARAGGRACMRVCVCVCVCVCVKPTLCCMALLCLYLQSCCTCESESLYRVYF